MILGFNYDNKDQDDVVVAATLLARKYDAGCQVFTNFLIHQILAVV